MDKKEFMKFIEAYNDNLIDSGIEFYDLRLAKSSSEYFDMTRANEQNKVLSNYLHSILKVEERKLLVQIQEMENLVSGMLDNSHKADVSHLRMELDNFRKHLDIIQEDLRNTQLDATADSVPVEIWSAVRSLVSHYRELYSTKKKEASSNMKKKEQLQQQIEVLKLELKALDNTTSPDLLSHEISLQLETFYHWRRYGYDSNHKTLELLKGGE